MQNKFRINNHWLKNRQTTDKFSDRVCFHVSHQAVPDAMDRDGGVVGKSVRLACESLGVRIPVATDLSRKIR